MDILPIVVDKIVNIDYKTGFKMGGFFNMFFQSNFCFFFAEHIGLGLFFPATFWQAL